MTQMGWAANHRLTVAVFGPPRDPPGTAIGLLSDQLVPALDDVLLRQRGVPAVAKPDIRTRQEAQGLFAGGQLCGAPVIGMQLVQEGFLAVQQRRISRVGIIAEAMRGLRKVNLNTV